MGLDLNREAVVPYYKPPKRLRGIYYSMKKRCYTPTSTHFDSYGGRGITICEEWLNSSESFYDWALANNYNKDLTIERIEVNGNYCPENCCWITLEDQAKNKRNTVFITIMGETKRAKEWVKDPRCEVCYNTLMSRYKDESFPENQMLKRIRKSK